MGRKTPHFSPRRGRAGRHDGVDEVRKLEAAIERTREYLLCKCCRVVYCIGLKKFPFT